MPNLWLFLFGQIHALGVTSTFEVENTSIRPTVLIVTNQLAIWISAQSGFSRSAQAKEQSSIAIHTNIGRTVHAQYIALMGKDIIQYREDSLFDFTCVARTTNQDDFATHTHHSEVVLTCTVNGRIGMERWRCYDDPLRRLGCDFFRRRTQEQMLSE